jgi:quinol monooxygenase YgiN
MTQSSASGATFFTATYVEVGRSPAAQAAALLAREREASAADDGLVRFEVVQRIDRPNQFVALGAWRDQTAFEAHAIMARVVDLMRELMPLLVAPTDRREHVGLAVGEGTGQDGITVVTHVDVVPTYKDDAVAALSDVAEASRIHHGNLRFDVWQQTNRPNHFTVVEAWTSRRAFDARAMAPATRDFRTKLAVMAGALYDERLYKSL